MKVNTICIAFILLSLIIIVMTYSRKENFSENAQAILTDFLTTQKAQTDEISKIYTIDNDYVKISKNIGIPVGQMLHFGHGKANKEQSAGQIGYDIHGIGHLAIIGAGDSIPRKVKMWDNLEVTGNISANTLNTRDYGSIKVNQGSLEVTGWTGGKSGTITAQQQLCIGNTCLNEDHFKILKGERNVYLKNIFHNSFIDCGGDISNASGTTPEMTQNRSCYAKDLNKDNSHHQFRLEL